MAERFQDQEFVEYVVKALVNHPEDVRTERTVDDRGVLLTLFINQEDMGYIIGRQGQTARALRILLKTVGAKDNARVNLKIYEPDEARRVHQERRPMRDDRPRSDRPQSDRPMRSGSAGAPRARSGDRMHGEAGVVSDADLADLGI